MARIPDTVWLGEHGSRRMSWYDIFCIHTIVGRAPAHPAHVSTRGDGLVYQSRDTAFRSAANLEGNHRIIASENEDMGKYFGSWPNDVTAPPMTEAQVIANGRVYAFLHEEHGIPLQMCPDSRPGSRGLAYHRQGIDGNFGPFDYPGRVSGGEVWTLARGKVCPTDPRIAQLPDIMDVAVTLVRGGGIVVPVPPPTQAPEEDDMHILSRYGRQWVSIDMTYPYVQPLSQGTYNALAKVPGYKVADPVLTNAQINMLISLQGYRERRERAVMWTETVIIRNGVAIPVLQEIANIQTDVDFLVEKAKAKPATARVADRLAEVRAMAVELPKDLPHASEVMPTGLEYEPDEEGNVPA